MENKILHGDSLDLLKDMDDNSVDSVVTDPPYGYSFMGKDWDKALPPIDIWKECVRVLKPGAFAFVMSAPRSDVHSRMCLMLEEAGFRIDFTPIAWTYATGFPKAMNIGKAVDKRLGKERKVVGKRKVTPSDLGQSSGWNDLDTSSGEYNYTVAESDEAKTLDGSYAGFQPKPAWENVIVCMKPITEKTYVDQAMKNGKGITWLDDCRVPFQGQSDLDSGGWWGITKEEQSNALRKHHEYYKGYDDGSYVGYTKKDKKKMTDKERYMQDNTAGHKTFKGDRLSDNDYGTGWGKPQRNKKSDYDKYVEKQKSFKGAKTIGEVNEGGNTFLGGDMKQLDPAETYQKADDTAEASPMGRFPANLLVQDDVLNDGLFRQPSGNKGTSNRNSSFDSSLNQTFKPQLYNDGQSFSRYYDLDSWWEERIKELPLNVQATYPFIIVPKASKSEKNKGCDGMEEKYQANADFRPSNMESALAGSSGKPHGRYTKVKNNHPTVKPISLMSYLVTLGSREDELVLDPFVGSGTTCIAAKLLNRKYIGMEMDSDYVVIAQERIKAHEPERQQHEFF